MNQSLAYFLDRFRYTEWANRVWLARLQELSDPSPQARGILGHVVAAEELWLVRITGSNKSVVVWPDYSLDVIGKVMGQAYADWTAWFGRTEHPPLDTLITYTNSQGERFSSSLNDTLTHVVNHGNYHRGQIALLVRQAGYQPVYTDFIHATRNSLYPRVKP